MRHIKYGDIIIIISVIIISIICIRNISSNKTGIIIIEANGKSYRYDQNVNREIVIKGILGDSSIRIKKDGTCFVDSPCRDKLCVKEGILKNAPLICMPNSIIIRYDNEEIDSFVQ